MQHDLFSHMQESAVENTKIYDQQKDRLSVNAWIVLFALLEGQKLSAVNFVTGIQIKGMRMPRIMLEYRRRITEIKRADVQLISEIESNGIKTHWIPAFKLADYRIRFDIYRQEVIRKINESKQE